MAICALVLAGGVTIALLRAERRFKSPGPEAKVCYAVSHWAESLKLKDFAARLSQLATTLEARRVQAAIRSGRLTVVKFDKFDTPNDKKTAEIMRRASDLGTNGFIMMSFSPGSIEFIVDSTAKAQLMAVIRDVEEAGAHQPPTAQGSR